MHAPSSQNTKRTHTAPGSVEKASPITPRTSGTRPGNTAARLCTHSPAQNSAGARLCIHSPTFSVKNLPLCMHNPTFSAETLPLCMHSPTLSANSLSLCTKKRSFWTKNTRLSPRKLNKNT